MKKNKKINFHSLLIQLPFFVVLVCALLCVVVSLIGYKVFKKLFEEQYESITQQVAYTALSYIDCDRIEDYRDGSLADDAWKESDRLLKVLTNTADLAYIYVTVPNEDFTSRIYIYDTINPLVHGTAYPLGQVNSLAKYGEDYINNLRKVMLEGKPYIRFVYNKTGGHVTTSIPVRTSEDKIVAILSVVKPMSEVRSFKSRYLKTTIVPATIVTIVFTLLYILVLFKNVVHPLVLVTHETSHFAEHGGSISKNIKKVKGKGELAILARSVEKMGIEMKLYIDKLTHATAEKERLGAELNVATQIQANMLPRIFPPYVDHPEIELFATMDPAKEVGGDFYDFFMVDKENFAVIVGDVSGKGVPAALFMVVAKTLLKNVGLQNLSPAQVFERVNNQLCEGNDAGLFVTCWMGLLNLNTGILTFANAGHNPPLIFKQRTAEYLKVKPNLMLAGMPDMKYTDHQVHIEKGDRVFVYTDGVTEATNASQELYGEERLLHAVTKLKDYSSKDLLENIRKDIDAFVGAAPQFDDITMLEFMLK